MDRPFRRTGDDILENEDAARFQDAKDFALETFLIRDAHLHLDGDGMIKTIVVERCLQGTSALKCSAVGHTQQFRKPIGGVDETLRQVDPRHPAAECFRDVACGPTEPEELSGTF